MWRKFLAVVFTLLLVSSLAGAQLPPSVDIPIQNIPQETQVWCWAAVSQQIIMAASGPRATPPQCALVAMAYGNPPAACCSGYNPACLRTGNIAQIQFLISRFGRRFSAVAPPTDPMTLYRVLRNGHPIILELAQPYMAGGQAMSHAVVVRGMSFVATPRGVQAVLHVNDPTSTFTQPIPYARIIGMWRTAIVVM
jgi:hypothetical protein